MQQRQKDHSQQQRQPQKQAQRSPTFQQSPHADSAVTATVTVDCAVTGTCTLEQVWKQLQQQQKQQQRLSGFGGMGSTRVRHRSGAYASGVGSRRLSLKATKSNMRAAHR
jgi:hypothetical protein